ncbi:hypothetical protein OIV83_001005 [Microbotryomycetes sp. JL201]|nr:hypothetical protein OIV83_001005 [Microbotryomycetes sp. JL201]
MPRVHMLSAQDVDEILCQLPAQTICDTVAHALQTVSTARAAQSAQAPSHSVDVQSPLRIATESSNHKTLYMPSRIADGHNPAVTAIKIVSVPKTNCQIPGLPGTNLVLDEETGAVKAIVNSKDLTGLRTAAASAAATQMLADSNSSSLVIFGTGVQAEYHARLIVETMPSIRSVILIARQINDRAKTTLARLANLPAFKGLSLRLEEHSHRTQYIRQADIICTCVPSSIPLFDRHELKSNVHINAIGSYTPQMQEFEPSLIGPVPDDETDATGPRIPTVLVDVRDACMAEAGELIAAKIPASSLIELGEVWRSRSDGDTTAITKLRSSGMSLFKCVGVGAMDALITDLVVKTAKRNSLGVIVEM